MFLSSVIATIGRPTLARSVESILSQEIAPPDFEVIVVNDSGRSLNPADWQRSDQVTILHTPRRERCGTGLRPSRAQGAPQRSRDPVGGS